MLAELKGRRVLLLQGPNGPFFRRLAQELRLVGAEVHKIHLGPADAFYFWGLPGDSYRGTFEDFPEYVRAYARERDIEVCFLFGDYRPYHRAAIPVLADLGVRVFAFEEGYLRPDFVTIEPGGVNARSSMSRDPAAYRDAPSPAVPHVKVRRAFAWSVLHTIVNSLCITLGAGLYPHYRHHRDVNTWRQMLLWARSFWRRLVFGRKEAPLLPLLSGERSKRYFLVGLQVHNDSQVKSSHFGDVRAFIRETLESFARASDPDHWLVVKHHPADRAYRDYADYLERLAADLGISGRVVYVHDLHLPTLLRHARGTVVLNSTVGLSSLHHGTPVMALGESIYGYMGLAASGTLDAFWRAVPEVDGAAVRNAQNWLRHNNQANGSIWTALPGGGPTGLRWPPGLDFLSERDALGDLQEPGSISRIVLSPGVEPEGPAPPTTSPGSEPPPSRRSEGLARAQ